MVNPSIKIKIAKSFFISIREDLYNLVNYLKVNVTNAYISSKVSRDIFHLSVLIEGYTESSEIKEFFLNSLVS